MKTLNKVVLGVVAGLVLGASSMWLWNSGDAQRATLTERERKPLYWVAPMDPNYKRDKPGKSPMGMDLIPVYNEGGEENEVGTVTISPEVINNFGVRTALVELGRLNSTIKTVGYVQYDENRLVHISPRVEGWVEKLHIKAAGDAVDKGQPLYALYSPMLVNAQEELLLALKRDNPLLIGAAEERLLALQVAQADINVLRKTRKVSQTITVAAPQSGVLDTLTVREGMFVKPGMSLMSIGQLEHIWVVGEIFERQANLVNEGDNVQMRLDYLPGRQWLGQIDYVYPSLNSQTRTVQIRVHFNNPDALLKPGMFAQMDIDTSTRAEALLIPREALIRTGDQARVVLALGDGRFKSVAVKIGRIGEHQVEILTGLNAGERIVTSAQFLIDSESSKTSDFKRMTPREQATNDLGAESRSAWVAARIDSLMPNHRMVTLAHEPIPEWQWPAMTMDFMVAEDVDIDALKQGMRLHVEITKDTNDAYLLTQVHITDQEQQEQAEDAPPTDIDQRQHEGINHDNNGQKEQNHD